MTVAAWGLSGSLFPKGGGQPLRKKEADGVLVCFLFSVNVGVLGGKNMVKGGFWCKKVGTRCPPRAERLRQQLHLTSGFVMVHVLAAGQVLGAV